ncbi:hypothetical protein MAPG_10192 [Magnaporthiopsis poae ATCC 64411]|uniref:Uncharacterized protein n=1 Tax=Magnaporthiopsis poae (strain ATCC 64411 / 73-15) TaxID=644358 RepID=A0A0C4EBY0_MAGP6|nr:hypothetical protein MAPG_10192 [Magnaporthiopsis poae ATCC 64411]
MHFTQTLAAIMAVVVPLAAALPVAGVGYQSSEVAARGNNPTVESAALETRALRDLKEKGKAGAANLRYKAYEKGSLLKETAQRKYGDLRYAAYDKGSRAKEKAGNLKNKLFSKPAAGSHKPTSESDETAAESAQLEIRALQEEGKAGAADLGAADPGSNPQSGGCRLGQKVRGKVADLKCKARAKGGRVQEKVQNKASEVRYKGIEHSPTSGGAPRAPAVAGLGSVTRPGGPDTVDPPRGKMGWYSEEMPGQKPALGKGFGQRAPTPAEADECSLILPVKGRHDS